MENYDPQEDERGMCRLCRCCHPTMQVAEAVHPRTSCEVHDNARSNGDHFCIECDRDRKRQEKEYAWMAGVVKNYPDLKMENINNANSADNIAWREIKKIGRMIRPFYLLTD